MDFCRDHILFVPKKMIKFLLVSGDFKNDQIWLILLETSRWGFLICHSSSIDRSLRTSQSSETCLNCGYQLSIKQFLLFSSSMTVAYEFRLKPPKTSNFSKILSIFSSWSSWALIMSSGFVSTSPPETSFPFIKKTIPMAHAIRVVNKQPATTSSPLILLSHVHETEGSYIMEVLWKKIKTGIVTGGHECTVMRMNHWWASCHQPSRRISFRMHVENTGHTTVSIP